MDFLIVSSSTSTVGLNGSNDDGDSADGRPIVGPALAALATVLIAIVAIVGNLAVIVVTFSFEFLRRHPGNFLIVYLSFIDMYTAASVMLPSAAAVASGGGPLLGRGPCAFQFFSLAIGFCSSTNNLAAISIDRALAVSLPLKYPSLVSNRLIVVVCSLLLTTAVGIGSVDIALVTPSYHPSQGWCIGNYEVDAMAQFYFHSNSLVCFYIPSAVLAVCYTIVIVAAKRSTRRVQPIFVRRSGQAIGVIDAQAHGSGNKTVKSLMIVGCTFYMCFTPTLILNYFTFFFDFEPPLLLSYSNTLFVYVSSAVNPFIYGIFRKDYRKAFKLTPKLIFR